MASALVMSPSRHDGHRDEPPLQTPVMRLESIFEQTHSDTPPSAAQMPLRAAHSGAATPWLRRSRGHEQLPPAARDASPQPHSSGGAAFGGSGNGSSGNDTGADGAGQSPSPEPRLGSRSASFGGSSDGSPSPDAVSEVGPLPHEGHLAAAARRSPFRGAASMSLDQVPPAVPGSTFGGGYRMAGGGARSPSPLRRFSGGGPGAAPPALRRRDSSAVSMSIVQETAPAAADGRHGGGRARSASVLRAPSGYSEDDSASEPDAPSFALSAPSGLTDDDSSSGESDDGHRQRASSRASRCPSSTPFRRRGSRAASTAAPGSSGGRGRMKTAGPGASDIACEFRYALQLRSERKVEALEAALARIDAAEGAALDELLASRNERAASAAHADGEATAEAAAKRAAMLERLQAEHASKARAGHAAVAEVEQQAAAAARAEAERTAAKRRQLELRAAAEQQEAEKQAAEKQEAERRQQEGAAAAQQQQRQQQQDASQQAAAAAPQQQAQPNTAAAAAAPAALPAAAAAGAGREADGGRLVAAASALAQQRECAARWAAAEAVAEPYRKDAASGAQRRKGDKLVTLNVQQIAATQEQVGLKSRALEQFLAQQGGVGSAGGAHSAMVLANRIVAQCEVQVLRLHAFAFPLAEVAVAVAAAHPDFMPLLLARLHQACQLAVPALRVYPKGTSVPAEQRLRALGYREKEKVGAEDPMGGASQPQLESTDDFLARVQGYVRLYAGITQSANPGNPHGLPHAWAFLARLLNHLPATRLTATALEAFLRVAGFALWRAYRGQFVKLLHLVDQSFLAALQQGNDPDSRAIATRIRAFLHDNQFAESPEGRDMPRFDASSDVSCRA